MELQNLLRLLHLVSVGFFAGSVLTMLVLQGLILRAAANEREAVAKAVLFGARLVVNPLAYLGFLSGLCYWVFRYGQFGLARLPACSPIFVHIMLTAGFLAMGMAQMWKARMRKLNAAISAGAPDTEVQGHAARGAIFALLAIAFISTAYCVAALRIPNRISQSCFADMPRDRD